VNYFPEVISSCAQSGTFNSFHVVLDGALATRQNFVTIHNFPSTSLDGHRRGAGRKGKIYLFPENY